MDSNQEISLNFKMGNVEIMEKVGDVLNENAIALIFPANPDPVVGGSMDKAIYEAAKCDAIWSKRKKLNAGEACLTGSGALKNYKWLIHAVAPQKVTGTSILTLIQSYVNAFESIKDEATEEGQPITVVSAFLGAGANGFTLDESKAAAKCAVEEFFKKESNKKIFKSVTFVKYQAEEEECHLREFHEHIKQAAKMLEDGRVKNWNWEQYVHMQIGEHIEKLAAAFKYQEISNDVEQYFNYCSERKCTEDGSYEDFKTTIYKELVNKSGIRKNKAWRDELMNAFYVKSDYLSAILNYDGEKNKNAKSILDDKTKVLKIGLGLCLQEDDFYRLVLSCGFIFPYDACDKRIIEFLNTAKEIVDEEERRDSYFRALRELFPEEPLNLPVKKKTDKTK